jgi:dolichyl-phosphate beta-glucosyltransferase
MERMPSVVVKLGTRREQPLRPLADASAALVDHDLTVIIPAYNEQRRLPPSLDRLEAFLDATSIDYRILVVDDGSSDATSQLVDGRSRRVSALRLRHHRGKGAAVRAGMLSATGAVLAFTDADLPYRLHSLLEGYRLVHDRLCEAAFGSRHITGAAVESRRRPVRRLSSLLFRLATSLVISRDVTDTQCGLKVFSCEAARKIFSTTTVSGYAFDAEVVLLAKQLRISHRCIPVSLVNDSSSKIVIWRDSFVMLMELLRMRVAHLRARRETPPKTTAEFQSGIRHAA